MLTGFCIVQQGERHKKAGMVCQDYGLCLRRHLPSLDRDVFIAVCADGVSSCEYSDEGARAAAEAAAAHIASQLDALDALEDDTVLPVLRSAYEAALAQVRSRARELEVSPVLMDSTLCAAVFDGSGLWHGNIGDSGIVALYQDGTYELCSERQCGEEAHSLYPLREKDMWSFAAAGKPVASFAMMTDGILDFAVRPEMRGSGVFFPFFQQSMTALMDTDEAAQACRAEWEEYFAADEHAQMRFRDEVDDDLTFIVVQNPQAVAALDQIVFDRAAWDEEERLFARKTRDALRDKALESFEQWQREHPEAYRSKAAVQEAEPETLEALEQKWFALREACRAACESARAAKEEEQRVQAYAQELCWAVHAHLEADRMCREAYEQAAFSLEKQAARSPDEPADQAYMKDLDRWAREMCARSNQCALDARKAQEEADRLEAQFCAAERELEKRLAQEERERFMRWMAKASSGLRSGASQLISGFASHLGAAIGTEEEGEETGGQETLTADDGADDVQEAKASQSDQADCDA